MSETDKNVLPFLKSSVLFAAVVGGVVTAYVYLEWGVLQILGAIFLMMFAFQADEKGPAWRRYFWSLLTAGLMVLGHFYLDEAWTAWGSALLSVVMMLIVGAILVGIKEYKAGDGSSITFYILGLFITIPITVYVVYKTLGAFGYF
jgi:hypothetical protein